MDPNFASPTTHTLTLGDELDFGAHPHSHSHSRSSSLDEHDHLDAALSTSLSSHFSSPSGLGAHGGGDLASELAAGGETLADELDFFDHQHHHHSYHGAAYSDQEQDDDGYRTPPRRGTRRRRGGGTGAATSERTGTTPTGGLTLGDSLAAELHPSTPPAHHDRTPLHSPHPSSVFDTPHLDNLTSNVNEMEESLRTTREFLAKLKGVGSSLDTVDATAAAVGGAASSRRSLASQHSATATSSMDEDTTQVEQSAASLVRSLYDYASEREAQIRELRDMLRIFGRNDVEWLAALAEVDALPEDDGYYSGEGSPLGTSSGTGARRKTRAEEKDFLGFATPLLPPPPPGRGGMAYISDDDDDEDEEDMDDATGTYDDPFLSRPHDGVRRRHGSRVRGEPRFSAPLSSHLSHLQTTTTGLIASLTTIHEHSQISKSAMNDAARRLRSIRTVMTQWKAEVDGVENSRDWIEKEIQDEAAFVAAAEAKAAAVTVVAATAEAEEEAKGRGKGEREGEARWRIKDVKAWTNGQMDELQSVLEQAEERARRLLTPVSFQSV